MDGVTLQVVINDFSTEITINVPKEAEEIANIGNDQDQFDNLYKEPDVDHSCYFVLVKVFVLCRTGSLSTIQRRWRVWMALIFS